jgi:hypothetical protein
VVSRHPTKLMVLQTVQAIGWRWPTFLLDRAWLEQPWKLMPKDPFDRLLDILLKLPEIFKKVDETPHLQAQLLLLSLLEIIDLL